MLHHSVFLIISDSEMNFLNVMRQCGAVLPIKCNFMVSVAC